MTIHLNKVNGFGGGAGGGGGSASFPTIVTDSGGSLPSASGYQLNDTFLNTSDKKIYKARADSYEFNTGVGGSATVDFITGIASNFSASSYSSFATVYKGGDFGLSAWTGNKTYKIHFKLNSVPTDDKQYGFVFSDTYTSSNYLHNQWGLYVKNKQIYIKTHYEQTSSSYDVTNLKILDYELSADVEYFLEIQKSSDGNCVAKLSTNGYEGTNLETKNFTLADYYVAKPTSISFAYGRCPYIDKSNYDTAFSIGQIYLLDSSGEFLVPSSELSWDNGVAIEDKNEYADKTNGILYLYENDELNAIPNLEDYKKKAETITISTASVTIANVQANKNYVLSSSALTDITLTACETSFEETSINFTTGSSAPTFTDNASIKWFGGVPEMKANTTYTIVIFNKQAYWQEQENV